MPLPHASEGNANIFESTWDGYYQSYLQVVHDQSVTISGYVLNSFSLASSFIGPFVGLYVFSCPVCARPRSDRYYSAIRYTGRYKYISLTGIPFVTLGTVLLVHFRKPSTELGYLVMCQLFNGFGTGIWAICGQLAVMSSVNHQEIAVAMAIWSMFGSIGSSVGFAIAGGIWTNVFPGTLLKKLPADQKDMASLVYGSIDEQKAFPMGSPIREATIGAYAHVQRLMVITGSCFIPLLLVCLLMWRNIDLNKRQKQSGQSKGNIW